MIPQLTDRQERFVVEYATNGGNASEAARAAGYSVKSAADIGRRSLRLPYVQAAITLELAKQCTRSGAIGLNAMIQIATNEEAPAPARVSAARALMEHAGMLGAARAPAKDPDEEKSPEEMTEDELRATCERLERELFGRAKDVTPSDPPDGARRLEALASGR